MIEADVDETKFVYIVLKGSVNEKLNSIETKLVVNVASYRAGEVFGDASIQKRTFDVLKCINKDKKYLESG